MVSARILTAMVLMLGVVSAASGEDGKRGVALTAADRAEIELLNARYALTLGMCNADAWPQLFAAPGGYFASASRGKVDGPHRLAEMIRSYDCGYVNGAAPAHAPGVVVPYRIEVEATPGGAAGFAYYNGGRYEDVYAKTKEGWRFASRTVVSDKERAAGFSAKDFDAIQQLAAANGGPYEDVYEPAARGTRFKSAGVALTLGAGRASGKAYLKDGRHYEDVYARTSSGWRFQSRTLVAPETASGTAATP